jgi:hypothetical protein
VRIDSSEPVSLLQFTPSAHTAALTPGSWEKVEALRVGSSLAVTLKTGERQRGALKALTPGALTMTDPTGKEFMVSRSEVGRIIATVKDDLTNGALIGAGVGLSAALVVLSDNCIARRRRPSVRKMGGPAAAVGSW